MATELLRAIPVSPPPEGAHLIYSETVRSFHTSADEAIEAWTSLKDKIPCDGIAICAKHSLSHSDEDIESNQRPRLD